MKVLACSTCGHIEFDEAPGVCLVCRSAQDAFQEAPDRIKQPANPAELTDGDKKHIPVVTVEGGKLSVSVGAIEHVMQEQHFIQYIDVYVDKKFISRTWLSPLACKPSVALELTATEGTVQVIEHCNVHGDWMTETTL